jgi:hypothetical protein
MATCTPFEITSFVPTVNMNEIDPFLITEGLLFSNVDSCTIYDSNGNPLGYCDQNNCNATTNSSSINCEYFVLITNIYFYIINQLNCVFTETNISNSTFTVSDQIIVVNIQNNDNISNTNLTETQNTNVQVTVINLQDSSNQTMIANLIASCIQNVLDFAIQNPTIFTDPVSMSIINSTQPSSSTLNTIVQNSASSVFQNICSSSSSISSDTIITQKNIINITITNVQYNEANLNLNQSDVIKLLVQNIATSSVNLILPQLYPNLKSTIQSLIPTTSSINTSTTDSINTPTTDSINTPTTNNTSTNSHKNLYIALIIIAILLFFGIIFGIIISYRKK